MGIDNEITIVSGGNKKVNAIYKGITIKTDQSFENGGDESAPEPFLLFLASIGTCAGIYVYRFCQHRNIPTDNIKITQTNHSTKDGKGVGKISLKIEVPMDFPEKYRNALVKSANLCAVKKHIQTPPEFDVHCEIKG